MMTAIEPQVSASGRYSIGQVCSLLDIHRNTLRKKTNSGKIKCGFREDGRKFYLGREIIRFWRAQI